MVSLTNRPSPFDVLPRRVLAAVVVVVLVVAPARRRLFCCSTKALKRAGGLPNRRALLDALARATPSGGNEGMALTASEGGADVGRGGADALVTVADPTAPTGMSTVAPTGDTPMGGVGLLRIRIGEGLNICKVEVTPMLFVES